MQPFCPTAWHHLRRHVLPSLLINGVAPLAVYAALRPHMSDLHALLVTLLIPLIEGCVSLWRHGRLNAFGALVAVSMALGVATALVSGNPKTLLARESLLSGAFGVVMLLSLLGRHSLVYYLAGHFIAGHDARRLHDYRQIGTRARMRRFFRLLTIVWGTITLGDGLLNTYLAFHVSIPVYLVVTPIARYGIMALALAWTLAHAHRGRYLAQLLRLPATAA